MGIDHRARTVIVVPFTEEDFVDTITNTTIITHCDHPEALGHNYCPNCGAHKDKRTTSRTVTMIRPKAAVKDLWPFRDLEVDDEPEPGWLMDQLLYDPYSEPKLKDNVRFINTGTSHNGYSLWLGFEVARTDSNRWSTSGQDTIDTDWNQLQADVEAFLKTLADLGITNRQPTLKTIRVSS